MNSPKSAASQLAATPMHITILCHNTDGDNIVIFRSGS
jgi:hypothetical protein